MDINKDMLTFAVMLRNIRIIIGIAVIFLLTSCGGNGDAVSRSEKVPEGMTMLCRVKTTPVKNQSSSDFCWLYAMLATIESEHIELGDSVNLSVDFLCRAVLEERLQHYYLSQGQTPWTARGTCSDALRMLQQYGISHYDSFHSDVNYNVLMRKLQKTADDAIAKGAGLATLQQQTGDILDREIHGRLLNVFMYGAIYTPQEFAHSMCREDEYVALTSFTHHPYNQSFVLEVPDNRSNSEFYNLPLDTLVNKIDKSLMSGHPVCWEGDISEDGFSFKKGFAEYTDKASLPLRQVPLRQEAFEQFKTTDDHCMAIVGMAKAKDGMKYYLCKNSWGTDNPFGGFMYMSESYLRMKTVAVWINSEAME